MDVYASAARAHMEKHGTTAEQFAMVASKNSFHGSMNPRAQFQQELSVEDVLNERMIVEPLTRAMCSPIGDGAAAAVVVSEKKARELGITKPVKIATTVMHSGYDHADDEPRHRAAIVARRLRRGRDSGRGTSTSSKVPRRLGSGRDHRLRAARPVCAGRRRSAHVAKAARRASADGSRSTRRAACSARGTPSAQPAWRRSSS